MTELRFDDRVAIVTGGGRGVGRSHALLLASKGASVVVADYGVGIGGDGSSTEPATEVVQEIRAAGGEAVSCFASVAVEAGAFGDLTTDQLAQSDKIASNHGISTEVMDQINAAMPPDLCAPAAAFPAHESCSLSGEILRVGLGGIARIAVVASQGINRTPLTTEEIAENLGTIMDLSTEQVLEVVSR